MNLNVGCRFGTMICQYLRMMRVRLHAKAAACNPSLLPTLPLSRASMIPLSVTIRPANNVPGSYEYHTDSRSLLRMLRRQTDISGLLLSQLEQDLLVRRELKVPSISVKEELLQELGYFTD